MGKIAVTPDNTIPPLTLPKPGASSLVGMPVTPSGIGPSGQAQFSIPLPASPGRGYAPQLALTSGGGNGVFGVGWQLSGVPSIRRRTDRGVPTYTEDDTFLGPSGEVLVKSPDQPPTLNTYTITTYRPRVEGSFDVIERWTSPTGDPGEGFSSPRDFWIARGADGSQTFFGKMAALTGGNNDTVAWMAQESISADGQHIYYAWAGASGGDLYLNAVYYGNPAGDTELYSLPPGLPLLKNWLFALVFDLGTDAAPDIQQKPQGLSNYIRDSSTWTERKDPFSRFDAGFEIRTKYLCRQVLMYHYFPDGEINDADGNPQDKNGKLVRRMVFDYDENPAFSRLTSIQIAAYEPDANGTPQLLPPLDIHWSEDFNPPSGAPAWQELALPLTEPLGATTAPDFMPYGLTDLYSEGMSGLLHQQDNCWYYRRPVRDLRVGAAPDAITFGERALLPVVPTLQGGAGHLADINGDGRLEWLVTTPANGSGYYRLGADRQLSGFTPLTNVPLELMTPYAMYVNIHGAGLSDVVVLSPTNVRYYENQSTDTEVKFAAPCDVPQDPGIVLPVPGRNPCEWVGFADVLGSGQPHLVRIRSDSVVCWPWLGNGKFGAAKPLSSTLPFNRGTFNPARVFLVTVFGPYAPDLVYADVNALTIIRNQSGNGFDTASGSIVSIPYPDGVHMGALTQVSFTDLTGHGSPSVLLTQDFGGTSNAVRHWRLDLYPDSPAFQLQSLNNNMGAHCDLIWRNSIQDWMDEKCEEPTAPSGYPSPSMLIGDIYQVDDITGLQRAQSAKYRRGVWDGHERESRGYAYMEAMQSTQVAATGLIADGTSAGITRSWYHTGREQDDQTLLYGTQFTDSQAYQQNRTRLTQLDSNANPWYDTVYSSPSDNTKWWMYRSLKGNLLRSETYDARHAASVVTPVPFSVQYNRWQVREVQPSATMPVVLPMELEQFSYNYEQVCADPLITQNIVMNTDPYGYILWSVDAAYPRRSQTSNPYANILPWYDSGNPVNGGPAGGVAQDNSWNNTFDSQQDHLRLQESLYGVSNSVSPADEWRLGVLSVSRENVLTYNSSEIPSGGYGLTVENLSALKDSTCLLAPGQHRTLKAYSTFSFAQPDNTNKFPLRLKLLTQTTTALLNSSDKAYVDQAEQTLATSSGYKQLPALQLSTPGVTNEDHVWGGDFGITTYLPIQSFARPDTQKSSSLAGSDNVEPATQYTWDTHQCALTAATDPYKNTVTATIDYRFLTPYQLVDANQNTTQVQQDALGRVVATSFFGTQLSQDGTSVEKVGFSSLKSAPASGTDTIVNALNSTGTQQQATRTVYEMPDASQVTQEQVDAADPALAPGVLWDRLVAQRLITREGRIRLRRGRWAGSKSSISGIPARMQQILDMQSSPTPAQCLTLIADAYPSAATQVVRASVTHVDGYGRVLSTATKVPSGQAFERDQGGNLTPDVNATPPLATAAADPRWAASETAMTTPGGEVLTAWPPYFVNDWQFVNYGSLPVEGYADSFYYDAIGREVRVRTGLNYWRRTSHAPWFTIEEDENDLQDAIANATAIMTDTNMETSSLLPPATQQQLPAMTTMVGAGYGNHNIVLDRGPGTIWIEWGAGFTPDISQQTISFTDNRGLVGYLIVNNDDKTLFGSVQLDSGRVISPQQTGSGFAFEYGDYGVIMPTVYFSCNSETNTYSGDLHAESNGELIDNWGSANFGALYLTLSVSKPSSSIGDPSQNLGACNQAFYQTSYGPSYTSNMLPSSVWPYSTTNLNVVTSPRYLLVLARDGTDRAHWLVTSDSSRSFSATDTVRTQIPADYSDNCDTRLYTGIVLLDENDQVVAASWKRAFFRIKLGS